MRHGFVRFRTDRNIENLVALPRLPFRALSNLVRIGKTLHDALGLRIPHASRDGARLLGSLPPSFWLVQQERNRTIQVSRPKSRKIMSRCSIMSASSLNQRQHISASTVPWPGPAQHCNASALICNAPDCVVYASVGSFEDDFLVRHLGGVDIPTNNIAFGGSS